MIKSFFLGITTFIFIFGWKVTPVADLVLLTSLMLIAYSFIRGFFFTDRLSIKVLICLGLLSIYSLAIVMINGLFDTQVAMRSLRALLNFSGGLALASLYFERSKEHFLGNLFRDVYLSLVVHAGLMLGMYLSSGLRASIYQATAALDYVNFATPFLDGFRISGLTYGLAQTSVLQMLGLLLLPVVLGNCKTVFLRLIMLAGAPLLVISILISGRSGLMIGLVFLPIYLVSLFFPGQNDSQPSGILTRTAASVGVLLLIGMILLVSTSWLPQKFVRYSLPQASEIFSAFQLSGPTINNLSGMLFLPDSWLEMLFGSSNLGRGSLDNIPSDVGWVKIVFAIGLVGAILTLIPYLYAFKIAWQVRIFNSSLSTISLLIFFSAILLNCKELALLTRNQWSVHSLLIAGLSLQLQYLSSIKAPDSNGIA